MTRSVEGITRLLCTSTYIRGSLKLRISYLVLSCTHGQNPGDRLTRSSMGIPRGAVAGAAMAAAKPVAASARILKNRMMIVREVCVERGMRMRLSVRALSGDLLKSTNKLETLYKLHRGKVFRTTAIQRRGYKEVQQVNIVIALVWEGAQASIRSVRWRRPNSYRSDDLQLGARIRWEHTQASPWTTFLSYSSMKIRPSKSPN